MYKVIAGDTFDSVSRKTYGTEIYSSRIASANPGVVEPLPVGVTIVTPIIPEDPKNLPQAPQSDNIDEVAISIEGVRFRFWDRLRIVRSIDSMDTVEMSAPFDHEAPGFRETFVPFSFKPMSITVGGEPLFTGTMVAVDPVIEKDKKVVAVSGYASPGALNDCTPPASSFPLEFDNLGLRDIAATMLGPFGLGAVFESDQGSVFERVACEPGNKVLAFLIDLAKQRNLVMSSSPKGELVFLRAIEGGVPVAKLRQGESPLLSVTPRFNPQEYYSHITGLEPVILGLKGSQFTVRNPRLQGVIRPFTFKAPDTLDADVKATVEAKAGRMFGGMASYSVTVATWRDPSGNLWTPNTVVNLLAPDAMVYEEYSFIVRSVEFNRDSVSETALLDLVVPGSFSGKIPEVLPWDA